jgi:hypothetical protein
VIPAEALVDIVSALEPPTQIVRGRCEVAVRPQYLRQRLDALVQLARAALGDDLMIEHVSAGEHRRESRMGRDMRRDELLDHHACAGDLVDLRTGCGPVAVAPKVVGPQCVDGDEQHVHADVSSVW